MRIVRGALWPSLQLLVLPLAISCATNEPSAPSDRSAGAPPHAARIQADASASPSGERITGQTVLIPIYNEDDGSLIYGSTPKGVALWPAHAASAAQGQFYLIAYPVGADASPQCRDYPFESCPDHGPTIAGFAMQLDPAVYGNGVLGHDHLSPPHGKDFHATLYPVLVMFTSMAVANQRFTTTAEVQAAAQRGDVFMVAGEPFSFLNAVVNQRVYDNGVPWVCPAYTRCDRPGDPPGLSK